jgi:hypothetical protein
MLSTKKKRETTALNVHRTQLGEEQRKLQTHCLCKTAVGRLGNESQSWIEPEDSTAALADLLES